LLDNLFNAVQAYTGKRQNYLSQNYLMVIRFYGYDQNGNLVRAAGFPDAGNTTTTSGAVIEKYIPFQFKNITFKIANKITEYNCTATLVQNAVASGQGRGTIPYNVELTAKTINEVFNSKASFSSTSIFDKLRNLISGGRETQSSNTSSNSSGSSALMGELFLNADGDAAGQLTWQQPASNRGAFPEGIDLITYEGVIGSRHVVQPQGLNRLGLEQSITDAQLDLMGDEVPSGSEVTLSLSSSQILAAPAEQQVSQVKLSYNARSGMVTGSMVLGQSRGKRARNVTFRGMRAPDGKSILGHYTVPEAANARRTSAGMMKVSAKAR
jgi:hypothetical protein